MGKTKIEWATWNPVTGCSKVSPGCAHCYAETLSLRFGRSAGPWTPANAERNVVLHPERLEQPLRWRRPRMVFVNSMSDLFHEQVPDGFIAQVFAVMAATPRHTYQVLTKRPERMQVVLTSMQENARNPWLTAPNIWLGVSIENRRFVHRADVLRDTPAAVRFISAEPLLGPLIYDGGHCDGPTSGEPYWRWADGYEGPDLALDGIDWLIVGGESGPHHRPMRIGWVRDLRDACIAEGVSFFFKQDSGSRPGQLGRFANWPREMPENGRFTVAHA